ncbi:MAG TPA: thioredoxin-disulfide reductase [Dehalococcoidia bacterium]|nr:thioredoxin-disulfide reductase [Dehalococcoidia bacterium]
MATEYDIVIIGGGPAGLAAGLYAARARRSTLIIEKNVTGGQIALTAEIENYPGIESINGFDLGQIMQKQAETHGAEMLYTNVTSIEPAKGKAAAGKHVIHTDEGDYEAKTLIITAGADYNKLEIPGEERLTGYGVSYCATCDAAFFKDQEVAVVGGGDAAMDEGLFVTRYASKVDVIHRRDELRASAVLQERAFANKKMNFVWDTVVESIEGEKEVEFLRTRNLKTGQIKDVPVSAVFIFIGQTPNSEFLKGVVDMDKGGHIIVNEWMETNVPGVYAAGDVRNNSARQVVSSAGDGATAAIRADHYISSHFK